MAKRMTIDPERLTPFARMVYDYLLSFRPNKLVVDLAHESTINNQTIWDWLRKGTIPQRGTIEKLARSTDMSLDDLLRAAGLPDTKANAAERRRIRREYQKLLRDTEAELAATTDYTESERAQFMAALRKIGPRLVDKAAAALEGDESMESDAPPLSDETPDDDESDSRRRVPARTRR